MKITDFTLPQLKEMLALYRTITARAIASVTNHADLRDAYVNEFLPDGDCFVNQHYQPIYFNPSEKEGYNAELYAEKSRNTLDIWKRCCTLAHCQRLYPNVDATSLLCFVNHMSKLFRHNIFDTRADTHLADIVSKTPGLTETCCISLELE